MEASSSPPPLEASPLPMAPPKVEVLELFSGVGGLHYGYLAALAARGELGGAHPRVQAYDVSDLATAVWHHNFPSQPKPSSRGIQSLRAAELDRLGAALWLVSPPCQPYTRNGKQLDTEDKRAAGLLHLCDVLPQLRRPPRALLLENVKGFEASGSRERLLQSLATVGYDTREFLLSPLDVGVPNSRLRYFMLAKLGGERFAGGGGGGEIAASIPGCELHGGVLRPLGEFMEAAVVADPAPALIPLELLRKRGHLFNVVTAEHRRSCCFTKNYVKFADGTGSVVQTRPTERDLPPSPLGEQPADILEKESFELQQERGLRFFSVREVARLHGFPDSLTFPEAVTQKQQYSLLGNSLSVDCVRELLLFMLKEPEQ